MQLSAPVRVVNGSAFVELLHVLSLSGTTGTYAAGETITCTSGAAGVVVAVGAPEITVAITSVQQPLVGDAVTASGGATGTLASFVTAPDLAGAGIDGGEWFVREGDGVAYQISAVPGNARLLLTAPYGGVSSLADEAIGVVHSTRTPLVGLPNFDRRDRQVQILLAVLVGMLDTILDDHETRITALEP